MWLFVHITFLTGFKNRLAAMFHWAAPSSGGRAERTITIRQVDRPGRHRARRAATDLSRHIIADAGPGTNMLTDAVASNVTVLAVDPVPWARSQMAFTLAFHIILVPLGVSWAVMALIANYRGIKHGDADALLLAQRWSKYMAVTFAVGAVTGTVLSFEFGLLWPKFMGQWGAAFGVPFAFEGIFFFTEAVFISIYIFGWRRLQAVDALLDRRAHRRHGRLRQHLGGVGERVDERARGGHPRLRRARSWTSTRWG